MHEITVWAPFAQKVQLDTLQQRLNLTKNERGWWAIETPLILHGSEYAFYIDDKGPFPNPRSSWQPQGVHGPSKWLDHSLFKWADASWMPPNIHQAIIYELHVGTFTPAGTFEAAIERLDYLIDLGITHIELMPIAEFSGECGWGYDGVSLYAPHHAYGTPEGLKQLVNACHQKGIAIILDVVYNHLGPEGNYLHQYGPYFTNRHATPWGDAINLDGPYSDDVRQFFIQNALMWLRDYHFDGLRLDAVHAILDTSAIHFLEELQTEVRRLESKLNRPLLLIAESDLNDPRLIQPLEWGGYGLNAQWNEDFHHALHAVLTHESERYYQDFGKIADLAKVLSHGQVYDGCYSRYRKHKHGRPVSNVTHHHFIGCIQNHDQVGNRALGERIGHLIPLDKLKMAAALVILSPFIPMLFQGEEWGASTPFLYFTDHQDHELGKAVSEGRQKEFTDFANIREEIPNPQAKETFLRSKLNWGEITQSPHAEILDWYRTLIKLRHKIPDFQKPGHINTIFDEEERWLIVQNQSILLVCNFSEKTLNIQNRLLLGQNILLSSHKEITIVGNCVKMPSNSMIVYNNS